MVIMDIAIPRDIDPAVREIDYVFYHDIDSLNIIVEQNLSKRKFEVPRVEKIINEENVIPAIMRMSHDHFSESLDSIDSQKNSGDSSMERFFLRAESRF